MSVNLHLSIRIRRYNPTCIEAIRQAVQELVEGEQLQDELPPLVETLDEGGTVLATRSDPDMPVVVSRASKWAPAFEDALHTAVSKANEGECEVLFEWEDADDDVPEYEPE